MIPRSNSLRLLRLLPWLMVLAGSPVWAQLSQSRETLSDRPITAPEATLESTSDASAFEADSELKNSLESELPVGDTTSFEATQVEVPQFNNLPSPSLETGDLPQESLQEKASLDSPPSPALAATLCDGSAQSLSEQVVITSQTVCQSGLTPPSLWWTKEQVAQELRTSGKLVSDWSAQLKTAEAPGQVRLVVNPQLWSLMDYFERYDFVSNFGLAARGFGYQTEIYNTKGTKLASYICAVENDSIDLASSCRMNLGSSLNFGYRGNRGKGSL